MPAEEDEYAYGYEEEAYSFEEGEYKSRRPRPRFGDAVADEDGDGVNGVANWARKGVWEGEWVEGLRVVE